MRGFAASLAVIAIIAFGFSVALHQGFIRLPPNILPWSEIALEEEPGAFARLQLNAIASDRRACLKALDQTDLVFRQVEERPLTNGCGIENGIQFTRSHFPYGATFEITCGMGAALYWYEQRLEVLAQEHLNASIARVVHFGSYACRNIYGRAGDRRSGHATANAFDVGGFALSDGTEISVLRDWGKNTSKGRFLADARKEACRFFNTVLSPEYNQAHANHFHFEMSRYRICR